MTNPIAKNVLDVWFGDWPLTPKQNSARSATWFVSNQAFDYDIERRFGKLVSAARKGFFDSWAEQPDNCLALIIILDQLSRNLYSGQASAFALMPYQHAEDLDLQLEGVQAYKQQADTAPEEWQKIMQGYTDFAQQQMMAGSASGSKILST